MDSPGTTAGAREGLIAGQGTRAELIDAVVTYHVNPYASGVVRFDQILAEHLDVPFIALSDPGVSEVRSPLLSFKLAEVREEDRGRLGALLDRRGWRHQVFLHDWSDIPLERRLVSEAARVWCGNAEIADLVRHLNPRTEAVWTPGLLTDRRTFQPAEISVFSFGMAHKLRTDMFARLRDLLEASRRSYAVYVSSATHETRTIGDGQAIVERMSEIFPRGLYFLGNLSDVAVYNQLRTATFFAAFFSTAVRANNTSVAAAMEHGSVVITNLDESSPAHLSHMENVIDIERCTELPTDPLTLEGMRLGAMESASHRSWDALAGRMGQG